MGAESLINNSTEQKYCIFIYMHLCIYIFFFSMGSVFLENSEEYKCGTHYESGNPKKSPLFLWLFQTTYIQWWNCRWKGERESVPGTQAWAEDGVRWGTKATIQSVLKENVMNQ